MASLPSGIIAYPVTPFGHESRGIDRDRLRAVTEHLLAAKPAAIAFLGSAGESAYLTGDEWRAAARAGVEIVGGRVPIIIGISELTTAAAVEKARFASEVGSDRLMVIPVSYWPLSDEEIFEHFSAIASATDLPVMAYNNPATSGVDMRPELLVRIVENLPSVDCVKESSGDLNRMHAIQQLSSGKIPFYNGANHMALEALAAGAQGWCTAAPNLLDNLPGQLIDLVRDGDMNEARDLFYSMLPVLRFIVMGGLPTTVKAGLKLRGVEAGDPRAPLKALDDANIAELLELLSATNIDLRHG